MKKRMLSILLCVCLALALLPAAALADGVTDYDVWVGGVRVTSANAGSITGPGITGTVRYDAASGTLTLDGASITGTHTDGNNNSAAIYAATDLTIALTGASSAVGPAMASGSSCGVYGVLAHSISPVSASWLPLAEERLMAATAFMTTMLLSLVLRR